MEISLPALCGETSKLSLGILRLVSDGPKQLIK